MPLLFAYAINRFSHDVAHVSLKDSKTHYYGPFSHEQAQSFYNQIEDCG